MTYKEKNMLNESTFMLLGGSHRYSAIRLEAITTSSKKVLVTRS